MARHDEESRASKQPNETVRPFILAALLLLLATPAWAQKVYVDFDAQADFGSYETFAFATDVSNALDSSHPLVHQRIMAAMRKQMADAGLAEVEDDPDLNVSYHTSSTSEVRLDTVSLGYSYGPYWNWDPYWSARWSGLGSSITTTTVYDRGTLIIDITDVRAERAIWRGSATAVVPENPAAVAKKIERSIDKMGKIFRKQYRKVKAAR